jgi:RNA polymerase sigma-70 factor (ECF subfamily)
MTDAQLITKFQNGDSYAFNSIVWRWEKRIYNFVLRYLGDHDDSCDVCQKTFIRAYRNLHRLRDAERFSTWLYQIAVNNCRDEIRRRSRKRMYSLDTMTQNQHDEKLPVMENDAKEHPEAQTHNGSLHELLNRALHQLPEEQRIVVIMKQYQGLKFSEIAEVLETPVNTVKSRMYYGLDGLRKIFKQWQINEESISYEL